MPFFGRFAVRRETGQPSASRWRKS